MLRRNYAYAQTRLGRYDNYSNIACELTGLSLNSNFMNNPCNLKRFDIIGRLDNLSIYMQLNV